MEWILKGLSKTYGWKKYNDRFFYAIYGDYLFASTLIKNPIRGNISLTFTPFIATYIQLQELDLFIRSNKHKLKYSSFKVTDTEIKLVYNKNSHFHVIHDACITLSNKLAIESFYECKTCYICNGTHNLKTLIPIKIENHAVLAHRSCAKGEANKASTKHKNVKQSGKSNILLPFFGVLIVSIIIFCLLGILFTNVVLSPTVFFILSIIVAFLICTVYKSFTKNYNVIFKLIVPILTFLCIYFSKNLVIMLLLFKDNILTFENYKSIASVPNDYHLIFLFCGIFGAITSLYFISNLSKNLKIYSKVTKGM